MGTIIRPEISEKNKFWIDRHRYYELKHFCLQYPIWKNRRAELNGISGYSLDILRDYYPGNAISDPTEQFAEVRSYFTDRIDMVEHTANDIDPVIGPLLLKAVTEGYAYEYLRTTMTIPCSREVYYNIYREFFWLLSLARK